MAKYSTKKYLRILPMYLNHKAMYPKILCLFVHMVDSLKCK